MMKLMDNGTRLKILISLSDQLWDDYNAGELTDIEYTKKINDVKNQMKAQISSSFFDMQNLASNLGYILTKHSSIFGVTKGFRIVKN